MTTVETNVSKSSGHSLGSETSEYIRKPSFLENFKGHLMNSVLARMQVSFQSSTFLFLSLSLSLSVDCRTVLTRQFPQGRIIAVYGTRRREREKVFHDALNFVQRAGNFIWNNISYLTFPGLNLYIIVRSRD